MEDGHGLTEIGDMVFSNHKELKGESLNGGKQSEEEEEEEKSPGGGVIRNFISALVSTNGDDRKDIEINAMEQQQEEEEEEEEEKGTGGILNNFISGILHPSGGEDDKHEEKDMDGTAGGGGGDGGGGGGGLIGNIVSHLPTPLTGDTTTASEEASILIHSIVHD